MADDEIPMLACRPRDLDPTDPGDRLIAAKTVTYTGSIEGTCKICGGVVLIGPNQAEQRRRMPEIMVVCFRCVVTLNQFSPEAFEIRHLGNPEGDI